MTSVAPRIRTAIGLSALIALTFFIYLPGIGGPYLADDIPNLVNNPRLLLEAFSWNSLASAALSSPASPYYRPLAMLSFALGYTAVGSMDPAPAKLINIILHLATGVLAYLLARAVLSHLKVFGIDARGQGSNSIALFATGLWLLHPLFVSTVLYTVQRMSILSALFVMAGCLFYVQRRPRLADPGDCLVLIAGIATFTILGFLCKENGALLPGFLLLIELTACRFAFGAGISRLWRTLVVATLVVPTMFILVYLIGTYIDWKGLEAPSYYFTVSERFISQFRVVSHYVGWILTISTEPMGLYHDDIRVSTGLMDPPTTLLSLILWVGAAMGAAVLTWQRQILGFGVLWFLWGQVLESSVIPMALAFEHRNYLPAYGLLLAFVGILYAALCHIRIEFKARTAILVAVLAVLPAYQLHERVKVWSSEAELAAHSVEQQPTSPLTLLRAAGYLANKGDGTAAIIAVRAAQELDSRDAAFVFADLTLHCLFRPHAEVEPRLERMLASVSTYNVRTAVSRQQFMQVQKTCNDVSGLDEILSGLYARLRDHPDREIALASLLGSAAIRYRRGELELALRSWEAAIRAFPEARFLKPRAKALRDRLESGEQDTGPSD